MKKLLLAHFLLVGQAVLCQDEYGAPLAPVLDPNQFQQESSGSAGTQSFDFGRAQTNSPALPITEGLGEPSTPSITSSTFEVMNRPLPSPAREPSRSLSSGRGANLGSQSSSFEPSEGGVIDFSQATRTADGRLCVVKQESVETLAKDPILQCTHKREEKCYYSYVTQFKPSQEEVCEENFEKSCQITFKKQAIRETVQKCYRPQRKVCNGQGEEVCQTVYESSCQTRYREKQPGKFVGDTQCEKLPVQICGRGCIFEEGQEECHNKQVDTLVDIPEETCDLNPQKSCRLVTRLVPSLEPKHECAEVPREVCNLRFSQPRREKKPLRTEWCLDESSNGIDARNLV